MVGRGVVLGGCSKNADAGERWLRVTKILLETERTKRERLSLNWKVAYGKTRNYNRDNTEAARTMVADPARYDRLLLI